MPLNKFASWGQAPRAQAPVTGIATAVADNAVGQRGFDKVALAIKKLSHAVGRGPGEEIETPSLTAVNVVASMAGLRQILFGDCDSFEEINKQLEFASDQKAIDDVIDVLGEMPDLAAQFTHLFDALDDDEELDDARSLRIAEMVAVEWQVLADVDDPDDGDHEQELA